MAIEMKFIPKREGSHMTKFKLTERTHVYIDPKTGVERIANLTKDMDSIFLLGPEGAEIEMARAEALGLTKPAKKSDKADKE